MFNFTSLLNKTKNKKERRDIYNLYLKRGQTWKSMKKKSLSNAKQAI